MDKLDVVIIGAGVIGLAIGRAFALRGRDVSIFESQPNYGMETSSRNSEIIHAGIYYPQNSLKANLCVSGKAKLYEYCKNRAIPHSRIGKLIVATDDNEIDVLKQYQHQAVQNGVTDLSYLSNKQVSRLEPKLQAVAALLSPSTGIVDSHALMSNFLTDVTNQGGTLVCNSKVTGGRLTSSDSIINIAAGSDEYSVQCNLLINSAGLSAPAMAKSLGTPATFIPPTYYAKGHYFTLSGQSPFSHLIYPLANNAGLGIHATLDLANQVRFGPDVHWIDTVDYHFDESRKTEFVSAIKRYYPTLDEHSLQPDYTGIRPKIVGPDASPADFIIQGKNQHGINGLINCYGMESPGLTASMAIAEYLIQISL